jgi:hypothetical protein
MDPMDIVGKSKEDASLPKGFFSFSIIIFFYFLDEFDSIEEFLCSIYIRFELIEINLLSALKFFVSLW